jgi:hypothetical protein
MPIGTDLVLHEESSPEEVLLDGERLGQVVEKGAPIPNALGVSTDGSTAGKGRSAGFRRRAGR